MNKKHGAFSFKIDNTFACT